jgi:hypothetical protein
MKKNTLINQTEAKSFLVAFSVLGFVLVCLLLAAPGCSDDDDDDSKPNASDVALCKKTADAVEQCVGPDAMGTTLENAKAECEKGDFDDIDRCLFDCTKSSDDCDILIDCFDGC